MSNNNGDFLSCMREVEEGLGSDDPPSFRRAIRKLGTHMIRMHQQIEEMTQSHTAPDGKLYDVKSGYETLISLSEEMKSMRRLLWTAQMGVYIFGAVCPFVIALGVWEFSVMREATQESARINMEQTVLLARLSERLDNLQANGWHK